MTRFPRLILLAALIVLPARARASEYYPLYHEIPLGAKPLAVAPFELEERGGEIFRPEQLRGKVWIAHFFFTTCPGPCVKTMPAMQRLQKVFAGKPDVALVSITVHSAHDTKELLRDYAASKGADPKQWLFLTGPEEAVHKIIQKSFFKAVEKDEKPKDPDNAVTHSPELLLIDRAGNIRGYVDGQDPAAVTALIARTRALAAQKYILPALNAGLNGLCTILLCAGYAAIRFRKEPLHIACMIGALGVSAIFLASYLFFHFVVQAGQPTTFRGEGWMRSGYFAILLSHTILAIVVAPLALYTAYQGLRDQRPRHVRVARWTLPIWLYVSVTGVVVYCLLYQLYPPY
jgi:protein SCO1